MSTDDQLSIKQLIRNAKHIAAAAWSLIVVIVVGTAFVLNYTHEVDMRINSVEGKVTTEVLRVERHDQTLQQHDRKIDKLMWVTNTKE